MSILRKYASNFVIFALLGALVAPAWAADGSGKPTLYRIGGSSDDDKNLSLPTLKKSKADEASEKLKKLAKPEDEATEKSRKPITLRRKEESDDNISDKAESKSPVGGKHLKNVKKLQPKKSKSTSVSTTPARKLKMLPAVQANTGEKDLKIKSGQDLEKSIRPIGAASKNLNDTGKLNKHGISSAPKTNSVIGGALGDKPQSNVGSSSSIVQQRAPVIGRNATRQAQDTEGDWPEGEEQGPISESEQEDILRYEKRRDTPLAHTNTDDEGLQIYNSLGGKNEPSKDEREFLNIDPSENEDLAGDAETAAQTAGTAPAIGAAEAAANEACKNSDDKNCERSTSENTSTGGPDSGPDGSNATADDVVVRGNANTTGGVNQVDDGGTGGGTAARVVDKSVLTGGQRSMSNSGIKKKLEDLGSTNVIKDSTGGGPIIQNTGNQ